MALVQAASGIIIQYLKQAVKLKTQITVYYRKPLQSMIQGCIKQDSSPRSGLLA